MISIFVKSDWMTLCHVTNDVFLSHHDKPDNFYFPEFFPGPGKSGQHAAGYSGVTFIALSESAVRFDPACTGMPVTP